MVILTDENTEKTLKNFIFLDFHGKAITF